MVVWHGCVGLASAQRGGGCAFKDVEVMSVFCGVGGGSGTCIRGWEKGLCEEEGGCGCMEGWCGCVGGRRGA